MTDDTRDLVARAEKIEEDVAPERTPDDEEAPTLASSND
jgi:hypothetical protein